MKASLVLMAAGLGKRYGGCKQLDGVGPNGEILMEYAIHDAVRAGFSKLVFIIKEDMRPWMDEFCRSRLELGVEIKYAVQSMEGAPHGRTKPYGTVHALLCAKPCVAEPFAVINADDYYGPEAFGEAYRGLCDIAGEKGKCVSVPYLLKNTVSPNGTVARAIFENSNGRLTAVRELTKIGLNPDGTIVDTVSGEALDPDAQVSMNMVNYEGTPLYYVFEMIRALADRYGVRITGSEVVGLSPAKALLDCAEYYLKIENFDARSQVMEYHLLDM